MSGGQSAAAQLIYRSFCGAAPSDGTNGIEGGAGSHQGHHNAEPWGSPCAITRVQFVYNAPSLGALSAGLRAAPSGQRMGRRAPEQTVGVPSGGMPADSLQSATQSATALVGVRVVVELSEKLRTQCGCLSPDPVQLSASRNTAGGDLGGQSADPSAAESAAHQPSSLAPPAPGLTRPERLDALDDLTNAEKTELLRAGGAPADVQEDGKLLPAAQQKDPKHNKMFIAERRSNIVPQSAAHALSGTAAPGKHVFQETQRCSSCAIKKFPVSFHNTMWDREAHQDRFCRKCLERFWCRGCKKLKRL